jgi:hypothetical protein
MADDAQFCPECSQPLKSGGLVLSKRDDDGRRACRLCGGASTGIPGGSGRIGRRRHWRSAQSRSCFADIQR